MDFYQKLIKKYRISRTLITWITSYILILVFPIITSFISYAFTENTLREKIRQLDSVALSSSGAYIDDMISNIGSIALESLETPYLDYLCRHNESELQQPQMIYNRLSTHDTWASFTPFNSYMTNVYAYFPASDMLYINSTLLSAREFYNAYYKEFQKFSADDWRKEIVLRDKSGVALLENSTGDETVFYCAIKKEIGENHVLMNIIVEFNMQTLLSGAAVENGDKLLIKSADRPIYAQNFPQMKNALASMDNYIICEKPSAFFPWVYSTVTPKAEMQNMLIPNRIICILMTVISILAGGLFIFLSIKANFRPLRELINNFSDKSKPLPDDLYSSLYELVQTSVNANKEYAHKLARQSNALKVSMFSSLIDGKYVNKLSPEQQMKNLGIEWHGELYMVILIYLDNLEHIFFEQSPESEESFSLGNIITINIATEMLSGSYNAEVFTHNDLLIGVVNLYDEQKESASEHIRDIFDKMNEILKKNFNFSLLTAVSDIHVGLSAISAAYSEAVEGINYLMNISDKDFVEYNSITAASKEPYPLSAESEQQIINTINARQYDKCTKMIDGIIDGFYSNSFPSVRMAHYFSYGIFGMFLKIAISQKNNELYTYLTSDEVWSIIYKNETVGGAIAALKEAAHHCLNQISAFNDSQETANIYTDVKYFVDEHFDNPNLNVNAVADEFNLNPSKLSSQFKQNFNIGLLDYISQKRIEQAKHLLISGDMPINQIALRIGYTSQRTFLRVFSNLEKISPGKYREIYSKL